MKTIEDAVIELGGKLPCNTMQHSYAVVEGMLLDRRKTPTECYVCKVEEFKSAAKRMGYINEQPKNHIVEANEMVVNARKCWPPVAGMAVELWHGGQYIEDVEFLCERGGNVIFWRYSNDSVDSAVMPTAELRPIRTHREKVIEAAENGMLTSRVSNSQRKTINRLYDLGMLVLPQESGDTKD